jgi:hypothetical protein
MKTKLLAITLHPSLIAAIDTARGTLARNQWLQLAVVDALRTHASTPTPGAPASPADFADSVADYLRHATPMVPYPGSAHGTPCAHLSIRLDTRIVPRLDAVVGRGERSQFVASAARAKLKRDASVTEYLASA